MKRPTDTNCLLSLRDWLRWSVSQFLEAGLSFGHGTDNAVDEARYLVYSCLFLPMDSGDWVLDARLTEPEIGRLKSWLNKRIRDRLPVPYLTGTAWFAGLEFDVDRRVVIPRSPIAELIEKEFSPWLDSTSPATVLDLCCGSGCIGIACANYFDVARVDLADVSAAALSVAQRNVERHHLHEQCELIQSDLFDELGERRYDLIVCNPPYVSADEMAALPLEYRHEPSLGLQAGDDGLDVVLRILAEAGTYLTERGILVVEVGNSAAALQERCPQAPFVWLEFERGGHGVFLLSAADLKHPL